MKKRITYLIAALSLAGLAATGITLVDDLLTPQDTAWGATDTSDIPVPVPAGDDVNAIVTAIPLDTAWG